MSNVMLTFLSKINRIEENVYKSDIGDIKSTITNETGVKYYIEKLNKEEKKLDSIIYIATKEVIEDKISDNINTTETYFKSIISDYSKKKFGYVPKFIPINYNILDLKFDVPLSNIINNINKDDNIYIDTTGGARNTTYLLLLTSKTLEYRGNKVNDVIYINILNGELRKIEKINDLFSMFDLINGVDEFTSFGSTSTLNKFFSDNGEESDIHSLVKEMRKFEESIKLCKTNKLQGILNDMDKLMDKVENNNYYSDKEVLFKQLIPVIKDRFMIKNNKETSVIQIIRWCNNNELIQQAITIYVEQIPKYLFDNKIIYTTESNLNKIKTRDYEDVYCKWFYSNLMGLYKQNSNANKFKIMLSKITANDIENIEEESVKEEFKLGYKNLKCIFEVLKLTDINNTKSLKLFFARKNNLKLFDIVEFVKKQCVCKNFGDIFETIKKEQKLCEFLLSKEDDIKKINENYLIYLKMKTIENIFSYKGKFSYDKSYNIQAVMRDYLLIKLIRNKINHASDIETLNKDYIDYFVQNGYEVSIDVKIEEIIPIIKNALERFKI